MWVRPCRQGGWVKTPPDHEKLDIDAGFKEDRLHGTIGAVIRDNSGNFLVAKNSTLDFVQDVLSVEAYALKQRTHARADWTVQVALIVP
jgi:hypothetical protein